MKDVYILGYKRTPIGNFRGVLSSFNVINLGVLAVKGLLLDFILDKNIITEIYMGCVLSAGVGQSPARQVALSSGLSYSVSSSTVNKVCGSGMESVIIAFNSLFNRNNNMIIAGGMESMSNAPYILNKSRLGYKFGHKNCIDHILVDGLEDAYTSSLMGVFAESIVEKYRFTRDEQDRFAMKSILKAYKGRTIGFFKNEIISIKVKRYKEIFNVFEDELIPIEYLNSISNLNSSFKENGTITAANSSSISDGAAVLLLSNYKSIKNYNFSPVARIVAYSCFANKPELFITAPVQSIKILLKKTGWKLNSIDAFEINEAFAIVTMIVIKELSIDPDKVNIFGGACALGHPLGASGTRIIVTLINVLNRINGKRGIAAICIGGGESTALAIEKIT